MVADTGGKAAATSSVLELDSSDLVLLVAFLLAPSESEEEVDSGDTRVCIIDVLTAPVPKPIADEEELSAFLRTNSERSSLATASSSSGFRSPGIGFEGRGAKNEARFSLTAAPPALNDWLLVKRGTTAMAPVDGWQIGEDIWWKAPDVRGNGGAPDEELDGLDGGWNSLGADVAGRGGDEEDEDPMATNWLVDDGGSIGWIPIAAWWW